MLWDLQALGGADRWEPAGCREWLLATRLSRLTFEATSVADDLSYVALADLATVLRGNDVTYRVGA